MLDAAENGGPIALATCSGGLLQRHAVCQCPQMAKPTTFPPGCKLATKPLPTGSATIAKTMGMVRVSCSSVAVIVVLCVRMRSGCSATSSYSGGSVRPHIVRDRTLRAWLGEDDGRATLAARLNSCSQPSTELLVLLLETSHCLHTIFFNDQISL